MMDPNICSTNPRLIAIGDCVVWLMNGLGYTRGCLHGQLIDRLGLPPGW